MDAREVASAHFGVAGLLAHTRSMAVFAANLAPQDFLACCSLAFLGADRVLSELCHLQQLFISLAATMDAWQVFSAYMGVAGFLADIRSVAVFAANLATQDFLACCSLAFLGADGVIFLSLGKGCDDNGGKSEKFHLIIIILIEFWSVNNSNGSFILGGLDPVNLTSTLTHGSHYRQCYLVSERPPGDSHHSSVTRASTRECAGPEWRNVSRFTSRSACLIILD